MDTENIGRSKGWKNSLEIIIPYFFVIGIFQLIGFYFAGLHIENYKTIHETTRQLFIISFFSLVGTVVIVWVFRKYIDKKTFASLGFKKSFLAKDIIAGIAFGFIFMLLGFTGLFLTRQINILGIQFRLTDFILSIGVFIFVAVSEELFLRGYILNNLMVSFNKHIALIISSLLFSSLHAFNSDFSLLSFIGLFIAGLLFGLAYVYTRSLWFSIALHFSWNFFQGTIFGFNVSGKNTYSLIVTKDNTINVWNGGNFGFEGSILSIVLQIFAIGIVLLIFKNRLTTDKFLNSEDKAAANIGIQ